MKVTLIQTGKTRFNYLHEGISDYQKRLNHYLRFDELTLPDIKNRKKLPVDEIKVREGEQLLKNCKPIDFVILLDENGKSYSSVELANYLLKKISIGRDIVLVIGGAYGFSQEVYKRANDMISLSRMTFSHQLVRLILVEQLYRAMTIIRGEPYHHD
jgi:23S rRNA (pseudouridine1915-N3)-methyltransferase